MPPIARFDFNGKRIAPAQVARILADRKPVNVDLPVHKVSLFLDSLPFHFGTDVRVKIDLQNRNAAAREIFEGTAVGGATGLAIGMVVATVTGVNPVVAVWTALLFAGAAYFGIRYRISAEIFVEARLSVKVVQGVQMAHLKLRPQIA